MIPRREPRRSDVMAMRGVAGVNLSTGAMATTATDSQMTSAMDCKSDYCVLKVVKREAYVEKE